MHLEGTVDSDLEYAKVIELVEAINGVKDTNIARLRVVSSRQPLTDTYITAKVKGRLAKQRYMENVGAGLTELSVETKNSVVTVSGTLRTRRDRDAVLRTIRSIKNVKSVNSDIAIT